MKGNWALFLIPLEGGTPRQITAAKAPDVDLAPAFSPEGRRLAYVACSGLIGQRVCDVNVIDLREDYSRAGPPRRVASAGRQPRSVAWSRVPCASASTVPTPGSDRSTSRSIV